MNQSFFNSLIDQDNLTYKEVNLIEQEASSLYQVLNSDIELHKDNKDFLIYLYALHDMLVTIYSQYYAKTEFKSLKSKIKELKKRLQLLGVHDLDSEHSTYDSIITENSQFRKTISWLNTNRSQWNYSRNLARSSMELLESIGALDSIKKLYKHLNIELNPEAFFNWLDKARSALNMMGLSFYGIRLSHDLVVMTQHLLYASNHERIELKDVFMLELQKNGFSLISDGVWFAICILSNFSQQFKLSSKAIGGIFTGALLFDAVLLAIQMNYETGRLDEYKQFLLQTTQDADSNETKAIARKQLDLIEDDINVNNDYYLINILGAIMLFSSFGLSLVFTAPLVTPIFALTSIAGYTLYSSSSDYKEAKKIEYKAYRAEKSSDTTFFKQLSKKQREANYKFWANLTFTAGSTALILAACSISLPFALFLCLTFFTASQMYRFNTEPSSITV